ncbi:MAG: inverse autotransporter beta domain-containing protein [Legionellales bacterium]|nr:inverse autotransporter beta domain-containing protein [Legionellales bacterium]
MKDTKKSLEGNFGFGYRKLQNNTFIVGGYAFYDLKKTKNDNKLHQATIGIEFMTKNLETRLNAYLPFNQHVLDNLNIYEINYNPVINQTSFDKTNQQTIEKGLAGFDIEIGGSLPKFSRLNTFVAFYRFSSKEVPTVSGYRIRSNYKLFRWLSADLEMNNDKVRGVTSYIGLNLSWNFIKNKNSKKTISHTRLSRKMTQLPVRDIDVIYDKFTKNIKLFHKDSSGRKGAVIKPNGKYILISKGTEIALSKEQLLVLLKKHNIKISDIYLEDDSKEDAELMSKFELSKGDAKFVVDNLDSSIENNKDSKQLRLRAAETEIKNGENINSCIDKNLVSVSEVIHDENIDNEKIADDIINDALNKDQQETSKMKEANIPGFQKTLAKKIISRNNQELYTRAINEGLSDPLAEEMIESTDENLMTKGINLNLHSSLAKKAIETGKINKAIDHGLAEETIDEIFNSGTSEDLTTALEHDNGLKPRILEKSLSSTQNMQKAVEANLQDDIEQSIIENQVVPDMEVYIENEHIQKAYIKYLRLLGLSKDDDCIEAFDGSIFNFRPDVSVNITENNTTSNIRNGYWRAITHSLYKQLSPKEITVGCTINHSQNHWTSSVSTFKLDTEWYKKLQAHYNSKKHNIENKPSLDSRVNATITEIGKFVNDQNLLASTMLYGYKKGEINHYDSLLYPGSTEGPYYQAYESVCEPLIFSNSNITLTKKTVTGQKDYTCGDHSTWNVVTNGIIGLNPEQNSVDIKSENLRAFTEKADQEIPLATVNDVYAMNLSLGFATENHLATSSSSDDLSKIVGAKINILKEMAISKFNP